MFKLALNDFTFFFPSSTEKHPAAMQAETSGAGGVQAGKLQLLLLLLVLLATASSLALDGEDNKADTKPRETVDQDTPAAATPPSASSLLPLPPCSPLASSVALPPAAHDLRGLDTEGTLEILRDLLAESDDMADLPAQRRGFPSGQEGQVTAARSWGAGGGQSGFSPSPPQLLTKAEVPLVLEGDPLASFLETLARPRVSAIDNPSRLDDLPLCLDRARRPSAARACDRPRLLREGEMRCVGAVPSCEPRPARWSASVQATR